MYAKPFVRHRESQRDKRHPDLTSPKDDTSGLWQMPQERQPAWRKLPQPRENHEKQVKCSGRKLFKYTGLDFILLYHVYCWSGKNLVEWRSTMESGPKDIVSEFVQRRRGLPWCTGPAPPSSLSPTSGLMMCLVAWNLPWRLCLYHKNLTNTRVVQKTGKKDRPESQEESLSCSYKMGDKRMC